MNQPTTTEQLNQILLPKKTKNKTLFDALRKLGDDTDFPVNSIYDLAALSYVVKNSNVTQKDKLSTLLIDYHTEMVKTIESEQDMNINVRKSEYEKK